MADAVDHPQGAANGRRVALLLAAFGAVLLLTLAPYLPGLLGAAVLYVVVAPIDRRLARTLPSRVSAVLLSILLLVFLLVPGG